MKSQKLGDIIELVGKSDNRYIFWVLPFNHNFKKNKSNKDVPALFLITKINFQDSTKPHNILQYGKIIDLSKFYLQNKPKTALLEKGATNICVLKGTDPDAINKVENDLLFILDGLMME